MKSKVAEALKLKYFPVAVIHTNEKPDNAVEFTQGRRGCVPFLLKAAGSGKTGVFSRETYGCIGGGTGLGFGNTYVNFPGGIEYFLSTGNKEFCQTEQGKMIAQKMPHLQDGEGYLKSPEIAENFIKQLPVVDIPYEYVVYKPLKDVKEGEKVKLVVFLANPDQLSALCILASYNRPTRDNVVSYFGAGCHQTCLMPYQECEKEYPKAIIGLTDISVRKVFDKDILSFTVPYKMFLELEDNANDSNVFLYKHEWQEILKRN
ncbi:DUF169 domain-containing protein [Selenomonadales bacterium OttesenSCG-928-I06]|nr:DUF169 domain-containing protein [Selenomonadales bacterium OttesenSCG-928-I06]